MTGPDSAGDPRATYTARQAACAAAASAQDQRDAVLAVVKVVVFGAGLVQAWLTWREGMIPAVWMLVPVGMFLVLLWMQGRVQALRERQRLAARWYQRGLARLDGRWAGAGNNGLRFLTADHPYARDLDVFGEGSLYELLCTVQTQPGEETLAAWLCSPVSQEDALARQHAVKEAREALNLREELAVTAPTGAVGLQPRDVNAWAGMDPVFPAWWTWVRILAVVLGVLGVGAMVWGFVLDRGLWPLLVVAVADWALLRSMKTRMEHVVGALNKPEQQLRALAVIMRLLEGQPFTAPLLVHLQRALSDGERSASHAVAVLGRRVEMLLWYGNQMFMPLGFLLLWPLHFAFAIEQWRLRHRQDMQRWLASVGQLETLLAFASYAFEHPADPFPTLVAEGPHLHGTGLGHPLMDERACVRNTVELVGQRRLIIVSGSNMSGKSTLLRTVGLNVVLAHCGAPVRAERLEVSELAVGATLRVEDSLREGRSRFFAELLRLRTLMDLANGPRPLLFLLDEILHGTNSHDRCVGAKALVAGLLARGALGLITTHDLALASLAEELGDRAINTHFEDEMVEGRMVFDYRMRPGVVQKSNALELMRSLGLSV